MNPPALHPASHPLVSVIVPLYNKAGTVAASVRSIAGQGWKDFEVLVVDDGSTDQGPEVVKQIPDPRFRLIQQQNAGPGAARNRGIAEARGQYLAFLDADDEWMPFFLERAVERLNARPEAAAVTFAWLDEPGGTSPVPAMQRAGLREGLQVFAPGASSQLENLLAGVVFMWPCTTMARAEVVRRYGGFYSRDGCRFGEDGHLWLKVLLNQPVEFVLEPAAHFHREASALSGNYRSMRPVEPFLTDAEDVRQVCPAGLRDLLERFLAMRAMKTACVLAYWGQWREAARLRRRFYHPSLWTEPMNLLSYCVATPLGAIAGRILRWLR